MYRIDPDKNKIEKLQKRTFSDLNFKERDNLQEWIANEPDIFGEELLIIQKEFAGFGETNERLDLLALDKYGSLVIIENKLDDTGRDVTWQALKYTSYCSSLTKDDIRKIYQDYLDKYEPNIKAEEKISEFLDDTDYAEIILNSGANQRIILTAAKFRKEVTSTVLWLLNYKLKIQCFRVTPYSMGKELFLNAEQIIPTKDAEDYMISIAGKTQDETANRRTASKVGEIRLEFWNNLLKKLEEKSPSYSKLFKPSKRFLVTTSTGITGVRYRFVAREKFARVVLRIERRSENENDFIFSELAKSKERIEEVLGAKLDWISMEGKKWRSVIIDHEGNVHDKDQWDEITEFLVDRYSKMEKTFRNPLKKISQKMKEVTE